MENRFINDMSSILNGWTLKEQDEYFRTSLSGCFRRLVETGAEYRHVGEKPSGEHATLITLCVAKLELAASFYSKRRIRVGTHDSPCSLYGEAVYRPETLAPTSVLDLIGKIGNFIYNPTSNDLLTRQNLHTDVLLSIQEFRYEPDWKGFKGIDGTRLDILVNGVVVAEETHFLFMGGDKC